MPHNHLASSTAACCWIPLFALRCEEARRPELASQPCALLAPDTTRRIWQVSPLAHRAGVKPGMTVSQAIGLCSSLRLCEPDRKSTRLNSSHQIISYAVFCLKKKK